MTTQASQRRCLDRRAPHLPIPSLHMETRAVLAGVKLVSSVAVLRRPGRTSGTPTPVASVPGLTFGMGRLAVTKQAQAKSFDEMDL